MGQITSATVSVSDQKILLLLLTLLVQSTAWASSELSEQEQLWIKAHPVVTYTVLDHWPQEFVRNGVHRGLSREVLTEVEKRTGLRFRYIPPDDALSGPPMMNSAVSGDLLTAPQRASWLLTFPWANTMPMIAGLRNATQLRTLDQIRGKTLAIEKNSDYISWLQRHYPDIRLLIVPDILSALKSVSEKRSAAAIASGMVMLPVLQRHYNHQLAIVAQVSEMASGINMAVSPQYPELLHILNQSMENISAADAEKMFAAWVGIYDVGTPSLTYVLWLYRYPVTIIVLLLILLVIACRQAIVARRRAELSEAHKSEFLAVMSHEIRTPMNAIVASLELLHKDGRPVSDNSLIDLALGSSQNLLDLLNSVLDNQQLFSQKVDIKPVPVDVRQIIRSVFEIYRPYAEKKGLEYYLLTESDDLSAPLLSDADRLRQILNNLLSNAVKFTDSGSVTLRVETRSDEILFIVKDSGIGIPEEFRQRLFQPWSQERTRRGGSGLGLYIARSLAGLLEGRLELDSQPGRGTQATLTLPARWAYVMPETCPEVPVISADTADLSVLIIEDHAANRELLKAQVSLLGCHSDATESGEEALCLLRDESYYSIILMDCGLPGKSGYQIAREIRQLEEERGVKKHLSLPFQRCSHPITYCDAATRVWTIFWLNLFA